VVINPAVFGEKILLAANALFCSDSTILFHFSVISSNEEVSLYNLSYSHFSHAIILVTGNDVPAHSASNLIVLLSDTLIPRNSTLLSAISSNRSSSPSELFLPTTRGV